MDYFKHYAAVNDLTPEGRRALWPYFDHVLGPWLPEDRTQSWVLDIGCGAGVALEWAQARSCARARGADRDAGQVSFARGIGLDVEQTEAVVSWLEHQPAPGLVILRDVLEHLETGVASELLAAVARRLAPGGRLYLAVPNANYAFACRWRYIDATHLRSYTEHSLRHGLVCAGLKVVHVGSDDFWVTRTFLGACQNLARYLFRGWRRLEAAAEFGREGFRIPLGPNLVVVAERDEDAIGG